MKFISLNISYNSSDNILKIKNDTQNFTDKLWITITDAGSNLNVFNWWVVFGPTENINFALPPWYYENAKEFYINVLSESFDLLHRKHFIIKPDNNKTYFFTKNVFETNYGSWDSLINKKEYDINFKKSDIVYDLGANVGVFSRWAIMNGAKHVYAYEPDTECYKCLKNTFANDLNINIFNNAILNENVKKTFYISEHSVCNSLYGGGYTTIEIDCINLPSHIKNNNLLNPTIIKCDIEGAEFDFINSLNNDFFETIRIFILEFHSKNENFKIDLYHVLEKMLQLGYKARLTNISDFKNGMGAIIFEKYDN